MGVSKNGPAKNFMKNFENPDIENHLFFHGKVMEFRFQDFVETLLVAFVVLNLVFRHS